MGAKKEPANPYNQRLMRGILTAFRALRPQRARASVKRILVAEGDVVHNLPIPSGLRTHFPGVFIDWVVEAVYAPSVVPPLAVRRVIRVTPRRRRPLAANYCGDPRLAGVYRSPRAKDLGGRNAHPSTLGTPQALEPLGAF
jgi:hypothetical protein